MLKSANYSLVERCSWVPVYSRCMQAVWTERRSLEQSVGGRARGALTCWFSCFLSTIRDPSWEGQTHTHVCAAQTIEVRSQALAELVSAGGARALESGWAEPGPGAACSSRHRSCQDGSWGTRAFPRVRPPQPGFQRGHGSKWGCGWDSRTHRAKILCGRSKGMV